MKPFKKSSDRGKVLKMNWSRWRGAMLFPNCIKIIYRNWSEWHQNQNWLLQVMEIAVSTSTTQGKNFIQFIIFIVVFVSFFSLLLLFVYDKVLIQFYMPLSQIISMHCFVVISSKTFDVVAACRRCAFIVRLAEITHCFSCAKFLRSNPSEWASEWVGDRDREIECMAESV